MFIFIYTTGRTGSTVFQRELSRVFNLRNLKEIDIHYIQKDYSDVDDCVVKSIAKENIPTKKEIEWIEDKSNICILLKRKNKSLQSESFLKALSNGEWGDIRNYVHESKYIHKIDKSIERIKKHEEDFLNIIDKKKWHILYYENIFNQKDIIRKLEVNKLNLKLSYQNFNKMIEAFSPKYRYITRKQNKLL
jgi:hypothetical protein